MSIRTSFILPLGLSLLLLCCGIGCTQQGTAVSDDRDTTYTHASLLQQQQGKGYTLVRIRNPWDTAQWLATYILVPKKDSLPTHLPAGVVLRTPLQRMVVLSSVHAALLADWQMLPRIIGMSDVAYTLDARIRQALREGTITDVGAAVSPLTERVLQGQPEAILYSPMQAADQQDALSRLGIPRIACADYMEQTALGRAEWMKFYGMLLGCERMADSTFSAVSQRYDSLRQWALAQPERPRVLMDMATAGTWYVPGAKSTIGQLLADAGMRYVFGHYPQAGSVPLTPEEVFMQPQADLWLIKYYQQGQDMTYSQMRSDMPLYAQLRPWQRRRIYGCNTAHVAFFETEPFRPDRLLQDLVHLAHPRGAADTLYYYTPLR